MYLLAIWLLDICKSDGTSICSGAWSGNQPGESIFQWPLTIKPTASKWQIWQRTLTRCCFLNHWHSLSTPLGRWFLLAREEGWYLEVKAMWLWHFELNHWAIYSKIPSCSQTLSFHGKPVTSKTTHPQSLHHASIIRWGCKLIMSSSGAIEPEIMQWASGLEKDCWPF